MPRFILPAMAALLLVVTAPTPASTESGQLVTFRAWIETMKDNPRGPFARLRWFCADGTVHPPRPYPCENRGGGVQHGEWSDSTRTIRDAGYLIATVLADVKPAQFVASSDADWQLKQMILERFLISADDGWILRRARYYRGAFQVEDEEKNGGEILRGLAARPEWRGGDYVVLREAVRVLPHGSRTSAPMTEMRELSKVLGEKDRGFSDLRAKLHGNPEARDIELVRGYAARSNRADLAADYARLVDLLEQIYLKRDLRTEVRELARASSDQGLAQALRNAAAGLNSANPATRLAAACRAAELLREGLNSFRDPAAMVTALDLSMGLEQAAYISGGAYLATLRADPGKASRRQLLLSLEETASCLFGMGLISERQRAEIRHAVDGLRSGKVSLAKYKTALDYLERVPEWSERTLRYHYSQAVEHMADLEPKVRRFYHDRLRGSPLLVYAELLERLSADAAGMLGQSHNLFAQPQSSGLTGLNAGLARGRLVVHDETGKSEHYDPDAIHVLPATVEDLPPVAGIITAGRGNALSHIQLLARNLGIPNVAVDMRLMPRIQAMNGQQVVLAVSPRGVVRLETDGPEWDAIFANDTPLEAPSGILIPADQGRLVLTDTTIRPLSAMRAMDSGRISGPKAANLGELKAAFPEAVTEGLVLPFGIFAQLLEKPMFRDGPSAREWLKVQYDILSYMNDGPERRERVAAFLKRFRDWIKAQKFDPELRARLKQAMATRFGPDGSYGVFVRSDTNVEDLPGFTGAGLNLTVPNVVGFDAVVDAIIDVWASPFTDRAFSWRQAHMEKPEQLYVSVLLLKSVPADVSGVLVTRDIYEGRPGWLSVAVNEGVGGAVAGQSSEELLIDGVGGKVRLMAQASEPLRRVLLPQGGLAKIPASDRPALLNRLQVDSLRRLASTAPLRFAKLRDAAGNALPADIEFGFVGNKLVLFQIRPFVDSTQARKNQYLTSLDSGFAAAAQISVDLRRPPLGAS